MSYIRGTLLHVQLPELEVNCLTPVESILKTATILHEVKGGHFSGLLSNGYIIYSINRIWGGRQLAQETTRERFSKMFSEHRMCLGIDLPGNFSVKMVYIQTRAVHQIWNLPTKGPISVTWGKLCQNWGWFLHLAAVEEPGVRAASQLGETGQTDQGPITCSVWYLNIRLKETSWMP